MNDIEIKEIQAIIEQAITPLKIEIATLHLKCQELHGRISKPQELPAPVKEAQTILKTIPSETLKALKVVGATFDPNMVWTQLVLADGRRVSIKRTETDFRVRVRDQAGILLKEANPAPNGLINVLNAIA
jgi:hypothetical protein